jgi:hypothetical protein
MNRRRRIYEGKAKILYEGPEPGTLIQFFKDDATAFNKKKHDVIDGKGVLNNRISEYIFTHLNKIGIPTHFIRRLNMREQLIKEVEIIPLEIVVRNVAADLLPSASASRKAPYCRARSSNSITRPTPSTTRWSPKSTSRLSAGEPAGTRRHHGARHPHQRFPFRPLPRRRHPARRLQGRMRPPL